MKTIYQICHSRYCLADKEAPDHLLSSDGGRYHRTPWAAAQRLRTLNRDVEKHRGQGTRLNADIFAFDSLEDLKRGVGRRLNEEEESEVFGLY